MVALPGTAVQSVSFVSLGCPKNLVDSEKMLGLLAEDGVVPISYDPAEGFGEADAVVVNTCGFLEASKEESLSVIREAVEAKEAGRVGRVVVAGCLVQRHRAKMLEWAPGIDAMVGVFDRDRIVEAVRGKAPERDYLDKASDGPKYWIASNALLAAKERGRETVGLTVHGKDGKGIGYFEDDSARLRLTPRHYAYLRVSEGCNQNCAFCTIPSIRGKMRSKPLERIAAEARELVLDGAFELNLIGQDTTSYGEDLGRSALRADESGSARKAHRLGEPIYPGLPAMLRAVSDAVGETGGVGWVRLMYAYPTNFSDAMIEAFQELTEAGHLLPYIDIPLQHASDRMLSAMRRNVTRDQQETLLGKLRDRIPGLAIRTTLISGFPGETDEDHAALVEFVRSQGFDALGVFEYSREEGTVAGTMERDPKLAVPADVKKARRDEIMQLQQEIAFSHAAEIAGQFDALRPKDTGARLDVLIDSELKTEGRKTAGVSTGGRLYQGRTKAQAPMVDSVTYVQSAARLSPGELVRCVIVDSDGYDLIAKPVEELERRSSLRVIGVR